MTKTGSMRFGYLILAGVFLFNPTVGVRDLLPDLLGYLFLFIGLSRLADLSDLLSDAQRAVRAMIWVGAGQILANALVNGFLQNSGMELNRYEQPVWTLLLAFVFLVLEWYFMLPAWKRLWEGLASLTGYDDGTARMIRFTRWFVILKALLAVLPEATVLTSFEAEAESRVFTFDWYSYVSLFRTVAVGISLILGVIWLVVYVARIYRMRSDREAQSRLCERYDREILPDVGFLLNRRVSASFSFFKVGAFFCASLTLLYREFLPDWIAALLFLCAILMLGSFFPYAKRCAAISVVAVVVSLAKMILNDRYLKDFIPMDSLYLPTAYAQYQPIRLLEIVEAVLVLLLTWMIVFGLLRIVRTHIFVSYGENTDELSSLATERLHRAITKRAIPVFVFSFFSCLCKILENELQFYHGWFWILQFAVSLTAAILFAAFLSELADALKDRFPAKRRV